MAREKEQVRKKRSSEKKKGDDTIDEKRKQKKERPSNCSLVVRSETRPGLPFQRHLRTEHARFCPVPVISTAKTSTARGSWRK